MGRLNDVTIESVESIQERSAKWIPKSVDRFRFWKEIYDVANLDAHGRFHLGPILHAERRNAVDELFDGANHVEIARKLDIPLHSVRDDIESNRSSGKTRNPKKKLRKDRKIPARRRKKQHVVPCSHGGDVPWLPDQACETMHADPGEGAQVERGTGVLKDSSTEEYNRDDSDEYSPPGAVLTGSTETEVRE